jgi:hypothetical protein
MKASQKDTTMGIIFEYIRDHAGSVHTAIKKSWNCNCTKPHITGLRLQKRSTGDNPDFSMAFNIPKEAHKPPISAREFVISIKKGNPKEYKTPQKSPIPSPRAIPAPESYIGKLHTNFTQSTPQLNAVSRPVPETSLSTSSSPPLEIPSKDVISNTGPNHYAPVNTNGNSAFID